MSTDHLLPPCHALRAALLPLLLLLALDPGASGSGLVVQLGEPDRVAAPHMIQTLVLAALSVVSHAFLLTWVSPSVLVAVPLYSGFDTARGALADGVVAGRRARACR